MKKKSLDGLSFSQLYTPCSAPLSFYACISVCGFFLTSFSESSTYCSVGSSSIPDQLLLPLWLRPECQHGWVLQVLPPQLHRLIPAHPMLLLLPRQEDMPSRPSALPARPWDALINSHWFDGAVSAQKEVIHSSTKRFKTATIFISPERFFNKHSPQMLMSMNVPRFWRSLVLLR